MLEVQGCCGARSRRRCHPAAAGRIRRYLRRIAKAEADYYEANIERRLRAQGMDERQPIELAFQFKDHGLLELGSMTRHRRRREYVSTEHAINHAEEVLESPGLSNNEAQPLAISMTT